MTTYEESIRSALLVRKQDTVDDACEHLGRSIMKMKQRYQQHKEKKRSRTLIFLQELPTQVRESKHVNKVCQALTLKGTRCTFKCVNGSLSNRHRLTNSAMVQGHKQTCHLHYYFMIIISLLTQYT